MTYIDDSFTIIEIPFDNNSQFASIAWYTNETHEIVRANIINELLLHKNKYIELFKTFKTSEIQSSINIMYNNYINNIKQNNVQGDDLTLIAASNYYKINICINETQKIFIDNIRPIDLYLEVYNNHYNIKIKYNSSEVSNVESNVESNIESNVESEFITILNDVYNYNVEHALNDTWTFWVNNLNNSKSVNWLDKIVKLLSIHTIEQFWNMYNNIPTPCQLITPCDFYLFKNNIIPMWEDVNNKNGGKITIILKKNMYPNILNNLWLNTLLGCIGHQFYNQSDTDDINYGDLICGVVLNIRKHQNRINLWINTSNEDYINHIINKWTQLLDMNINMSFVKHDIEH